MSSHKKSHSPPTWRRKLGLILSAACFCVIAWMAYKNPEALTKLASLPPKNIALASALLTIYFLVYSLRLQSVVEFWAKCHIPKIHFLKVVIFGRLYNTLFPQLGFIYRGMTLKRDYGIQHSNYFGSQVAFGILDLTVNILIYLTVWVAYEKAFYQAALVFIICGSSALFIFTKLRHFPLPNTEGKLMQWLKEFRTRCSEISQPSFYIPFFTLSLASLVLMTAVFSVYFNQLSSQLSLPAIILFYTLYRITFYLSITPGNLGLREVAFGFIGVGFGLPAAAAALIALSIRIQAYIILAIMALPLFFYEKQARRHTTN